MTFELVGGGRLMATGTITPGIWKNFAAEAERHSEYIRTVVLYSPGGSVTDALAMGRLIREKRFATEVEAGKYCVSSCPLVFAGGVDRRVGDKASIGVHQIVTTRSAANGPAPDEMSIAQNISARCQRYLGDMGVNLQVWVHAMETPHDRLFVFRPDELKSLNLVTAAAVAAPATAKTLPGRPGACAGTLAEKSGVGQFPGAIVLARREKEDASKPPFGRRRRNARAARFYPRPRWEMARLDHQTRTDGLKSELGCGTRAKRYAASTCATRFSQKHQMRCWPMTVMGSSADSCTAAITGYSPDSPSFPPCLRALHFFEKGGSLPCRE
jgi:ATP-dependent protease ClpP protease subunit